MAKFYFRNDNAKDVQLIVEPWAMAELVPAGAIVEFEVNDAPPPEIHFGIAEEGQAYVYVMSERISIDINGERFDYETDERPRARCFTSSERTGGVPETTNPLAAAPVRVDRAARPRASPVARA